MVLESVPRRGSAGPDELAAKAGLDIRTAMRKLTLLESMGFVARRAGGYTIVSKHVRARASDSPPADGGAVPVSATVDGPPRRTRSRAPEEHEAGAAP
jgi:DNA processing protein